MPTHRVDAVVAPDGLRRGTHRIAAFDGLRGLACLLVTLSHLWVVVPMDAIDATGPARGLFRSGGLGVIIFFALGGYLVISGLMTFDDSRPATAIRRFWLRRLLRIGGHLVPVLLTIGIVAALDRTDPHTATQTRDSLTASATFTLNWKSANPFGTRFDVGHLWYLSVEQQAYLVLVFAVVWLKPYRKPLAAVLLGAAAAVMVNRWLVLERDGWYAASLRTFTRADPLLLGGAAALLCTSSAHQLADRARHVVLPALVAMAAVIGLAGSLDETAYLQTLGIVFTAAVILLVVSVVSVVAAGEPGGLGQRLLALPPLRFIGAVSLPLYLWHLPVFAALARWATDMAWAARLAIASVAIASLVTISHFAIERPVQRALRRHRLARGTRHVFHATA